MQKKYSILILVMFVIISIGIKLIVPSNFDNFSDSESYYTLRQIESFKATNNLLYKDDLSFSGKESVFLPGFYLILGLIYKLFDNIYIIKFIVTIFSTMSLVFLYLIIKSLTKNNTIALAVAFFSMFIPIFLQKTTNTLNPLTLSITLLLACIYFFAEYGQTTNKSLLYFISLALLCLTSSLSLILLAIIAIYIILLKVENINISKDKKEISIFSFIFIIWINLIFFKKAIQIHGINAIWQNIPTDIILNYYNSINMISIIYFIGIIPLVLAIYGLYNNVYKSKKSEFYVYVAFVSSSFILLLFRLINLELGLIILSFGFAIFSGIGISDLKSYIKKTKYSKFINYFLSIIIIFFFITTILPSLYNANIKQIDNGTIDALEWIHNNTENNSIVIGTIQEGHLISAIAKRKNIIDSNFLITKHIDQIFDDIQTIYISPIAIKSIEIANKYNANYILIDNSKEIYKTSDLRFSESSVVKLVYEKDNIKIYKFTGRVEKYE